MPLVRTEDLIDAQEVAQVIGLAQRNSVSLYLHKYPDMPRPVIDLGPSRPRLWLRPEIESWVQHRRPVTRGRPRKSSSTPAEQPAALPDDKAPPRGGKAPPRGGCVSGGVPRPNDRNRTVRLAEQRLDALRASLPPLRRLRRLRVGLKALHHGNRPVGADQRLDALVPLAEASFDRTNRKELVASMILAAPVDGTKLVEMIRKYRQASAGQAKLDGREVDRFAGVRCLRVPVVAVGLRR